MTHQVAALCMEAAVNGRGEFDGSRVLPASHWVGVATFEVQQSGEPVEFMTFTQELATLVQPGLDWLASRRMIFCEVEQWVDLTHYLSLDPYTQERQGGSLDLGWVEIDDGSVVVTIWDWKIGQEPVDVFRNWQLMLYALGFWRRHQKRLEGLLASLANPGPLTFRLAIEQPRVAGGGDFYYLALVELLLFGDWICDRANEVVKEFDNFVPGLKQCRWCAVRENNKCEAYDKFMLKTMTDKLPDIIEDVSHRAPPPQMPRFLTPERRGWLLRHKRVIIEWLERQHAEALDDALRGLPTPGQKVIRGRRGNREWLVEAWAVENLKPRVAAGDIESVYKPREVISPARAEEQLGGKIFNRDFKGLIHQGPGKPVLVDEDDPGEALRPAESRMPDLPPIEDEIPF